MANEKTEAEHLPVPAKRQRLALIAVAALGLLLTGLVLWASAKRDVTYHPVAVASSPETEFAPALSPDGGEILFTVRANEKRPANFRKALPAGETQRLVGGAYHSAKFSMDGRFLAVDGNQPTGRSRYFAVIDRQTGTEQPLGEFTGDDESDFSWMADNKTLVVSYNRFPGEPLSLVRVDRETGKRTQLTFPEAGTVGDFASAFSPDGRWAGVVRCRARSECHLYLMPATGVPYGN